MKRGWERAQRATTPYLVYYYIIPGFLSPFWALRRLWNGKALNNFQISYGNDVGTEEARLAGAGQMGGSLPVGAVAHC